MSIAEPDVRSEARRDEPQVSATAGRSSPVAGSRGQDDAASVSGEASRAKRLRKRERLFPSPAEAMRQGKKELAISYDSITLLPYTSFAVVHGTHV